jgi:hypothetical protein
VLIIPEESGGGIRILNCRELVVPKPGVLTAMLAVAAAAISDARIEPCNWPEFTYIVVRFDPFHWITELLMKFEPSAVRTNSGSPIVAELGEMLPSVGGVSTEKLRLFERGASGTWTVIVAVLLETISLANILACNELLLIKVVDRLDPFHWTAESLVKFEPVKASVNPAPPAGAILGLRALITAGGLVIVNAIETEVPASGVYTVTLAVPGVAISDARIEACNPPSKKYVVVRSDPFHRITEFGMKFPPEAARVNPGPPAIAEWGDIQATPGTGGAVIVYVKAEEVPPFGVYTVTPAVPITAISDARIEPVNWVELT